MNIKAMNIKAMNIKAMNILPIIVSCKKNKHLWHQILKNNPNSIIFYGDDSLKENYSYNEETRILALKCNDYYEGLPEKMIAVISAILEIEHFSNIQYILKVDDHDMVNRNVNLEGIMIRLARKPNNDYIGNRVIKINELTKVNRKWHFGKCSPGSFWEKQSYTGTYTSWADGGAGYILSRTAMDKISSIYHFNNIHTVKNIHIFEDLMIAIILKQFNIIPIKY
jgi:hypothetical protein